MGGTGSGRYPMGSGKKPKKKKIERRGGARPNSGRKQLGDKKRVLVSARVEPATKEVIDSISDTENVGVGVAIDKLAAYYKEGNAQEPESPSEPVQGNLF